MEDIANWISENPYIAVAGLLATFLGLIVAIITPIIQRKRKQLHYTVTTTSLVEEKISNIENIEIFFSGEKIQTLSVTNLKIWNGGNTLIDYSDIYLGHDLVLRAIERNCSILGIDVIDQSADTIECKVDSKSGDFRILFQTFEKKDYVIINIYHTGDANTYFKLDGKIKEGKILDKTIDVDEIISIVTEITSVSSISLLNRAIPIVILPIGIRLLKKIRLSKKE